MTKPPSHFVLPNYKIPLYARLANGFEPPRRPGLDDTYREVINVLRQYSAQAVIQVALNELWREPESKLEFVQRLPWLHLLLVKWALQDRRVGLTFGPQYSRYSTAIHHELVSKLWNVKHRAIDDAPSPGAIHRLLRRTMHTQFDFQRGPDWSFLRWPALISRLPATHGARRQFKSAMGMSPEIFSSLAVAVFSYVQGDSRVLNARDLSPLYPAFGTQLSHFLSLFARTLAQLRDELQADTALRTRGMGELHEFPYLQRFPLLDLGGGAMQAWHPLVFARGLENATHHRLSDLGQAYTKTFSKIFESYVTELVLLSYPQAIDEAAFRQRCGPSGKVVEAAIAFGPCNVFIEAKLSLFHDDVILVDDPDVLRHKTIRIREAINQGLDVSRAVRMPDSPLHEEFGAAPTDFLIVVTSRDLKLVSGDHMQRLMPEHRLVPEQAQGVAHPPLNHIFIIDIADFEMVMAATQAGQISLPELLQQAASANLDLVSGRVRLSEHVDWQKVARPDVALLSNASRSAQDRVLSALNAAPVSTDRALTPPTGV